MYGVFRLGFFKMSQDFKLKLLLGLYVTMMICANIFGTKIWEIRYPEFVQSILSPLDNLVFTFGSQTVIPFSSQALSFSVGLFALPILFLITDIVAEVKGSKEANDIFKIGLICLAVLLAYSVLVVNLPPAQRFLKNEEYVSVFGQSIRFILASFTAFAVSQSLDIVLFERIKSITAKKFLWFRNNLSTFISQFIDTSVFYLIAFTKLPFDIPFLGISANQGLDFDFMVKIFIPYYIFKVLFALLDTPLVYLGVWWLRGSKASVS